MRTLCLVFWLVRTTGLAALPAIPEPPGMLYGTVTDATTNQTVTITAVTWQVTDGTESGTFTLTSAPPARIVEQGGQSYYVLQVPFETRVVKTAGGQTISLTRRGQSLELESPPPTYTLTPFINGRAVTIRSVDGVPAGGPALTLQNAPATNGKMLRVDLTLPVATDYAAWAATYFPDLAAAQAQTGADPDGDGATNEQECTAGTDPKNALSRMLVKSIVPAGGGGFVITWDSIGGKTYCVERSPDMKIWTAVRTAILGTGSPVSVTDSQPGAGQMLFYRVKVAQP